MSGVSTIQKGEVAGSFLVGIAAAFNQWQIIPEKSHTEDFDATKWYPFPRLIEAIDAITKIGPDSDIILFYAGLNFIKIWLNEMHCQIGVFSTLDWLRNHDESSGYNSAVRGGDKDEIGWCRTTAFDVQAGIAVYEHVTPIPPAFARGIFYGGCTIFNDLEYVDVETSSEFYEADPLFIKCFITVRYRVKSETTSNAIDLLIDNKQSCPVRPLSAEETETLVWRQRGMQIQMALDKAYREALDRLLAQYIADIRLKTKELAQRNSEIEYLANYDALTTLPTRRLAIEALKGAFEPRVSTRRTALLFIDLDGFKSCNDRFGHSAGDRILQTVAERMVKCLRQGDMVARIGGDEFLILLKGVRKTFLPVVAKKLLAEIAKPIVYKSIEISIGSSIGIAVADDGMSSETLLNNADEAMYSVKCKGKNNFAFFDPEDHGPHRPDPWSKPRGSSRPDLSPL